MGKIEVTAQVRGNVGHIAFAKPPHNYACPTLLGQIADAIDQFDSDRNVSCILLSSMGKSFCAGADLAGDEAIVAGNGMDAIGQLYVQAKRIFRRQKPMVAVVQGAAIGAGLGLALAADFRIAGPDARFSANFVRLGFHQGFALSHTLPRLIGPQKASWMLLSAQRIKPAEALAWGMADMVDESGDLLRAAFAFADEIAVNAPLALVSVRKTLMNDTFEVLDSVLAHEHEQQSLLKGTSDYLEGVASVFERRDAKFTGS